MNGINANSFLKNTSLFPQNKELAGSKKTNPGVINTPGSKRNRPVEQEKEIRDTVELNSDASNIKKAGYERPAMQVQKQEETTPKKVDANGVQEGVTLSEEAQALLDKLKEKYGDMDFYIAETASDEEASYYMNQGQKQYSVLIDPETLEKMAADEDVLASYEEVLDGTDEMFASVKETIGEENMQYVHAVNISFDKEGNKSYLVELMNDFGQAQKNQHDKDAVNSSQDKKEKEDAQVVRVKSNNIEELIAKLQEAIIQMKEEATQRLEEETTIL